MKSKKRKYTKRKTPVKAKRKYTRRRVEPMLAADQELSMMPRPKGTYLKLVKAKRKKAKRGRGVESKFIIPPKPRKPRAEKYNHGFERLKIYECRDGTRTCAAVMSPSHLAFAIGAMLRTGKSCEEKFGNHREGAEEYVHVFLRELIDRQRAGTIIEKPADASDFQPGHDNADNYEDD